MPFHPVDIHVGSRVKLRRKFMHISQDKLGKELGITFQQIQKYEKGSNRIGASRLYELSQCLNVPPAFFFDDMPKIERPTGFGPGGRDDDKDFISPYNHDQYQLSRNETLLLVRAYYNIKDKTVRKRMFELVKAVAGLPMESRSGD